MATGKWWSLCKNIECGVLKEYINFYSIMSPGEIESRWGIFDDIALDIAE